MQANFSISKQHNQKRKSNQLDKICSKLEISIQDIKNDKTLSKSVKLKIQKFIQNDEVKQLHVYLDKKVLSYEVEIGIKSIKWNILHFAAKNNVQKLLKVILTRTYKQLAQKYKQLLNKRTSQGYNGLMISIIHCSRESFSLFSQHGGCDIEDVDKKRMTAYDLTLNSKNGFAIKELMIQCSDNESNKEGLFINDQLLMKPLDPALYSQSDWYSSMASCFVDLCLCFRQSSADDQLFYTKPSNQRQHQQPFQEGKQNFLQRNFTGAKIMSLLGHSSETPFLSEYIPIENKEVESKYQIQWRRLSTVNGQKPVLFDCFQPSQVDQLNSQQTENYHSIQNSKSSEYMSLAVKDTMSHKFYIIKQFKGWMDAGSKHMSVQEMNSYYPDMIKFPHKKGEYLFMFDIQLTYDPTARDSIILKTSHSQTTQGIKFKQIRSKELLIKEEDTISIQKTIKKHQLYVICWSEDPAHLEHIEEEFAVIDCLESQKKNMIKNWSFVDKKEAESGSETILKYVTERMGHKMILLTKSFKNIELSIQIKGDEQDKEKIYAFVHEGYLNKIQEQKTEDKDSSIHLFNIKLVHNPEHAKFQYAIIGGYDDLFKQAESSNFKLNPTKQQIDLSKLNSKH